MKVSLKEARRIERRIETEQHNKPVSFDSSISIYEAVDVDFALEKARTKTEDAIENLVGLIMARSLIRRAIQQANEEYGINAFISEREEYIRLSAVWTDVINAGVGDTSAYALRKMIETELERSKTVIRGIYNGNSDDGVSFNTVSKSLIESANNEKRLTQKNIDTCDDSIAGKNATVTIEIPCDVVELLNKNNII